MSASWKVLLIGLVAAVLALAAGCGGDDGGGGGGSADATAGANSENGGSREEGPPEVTTSSLTKAQFVKRANAACAKEKENFLGDVATYAQEHRKEGRPVSTLGQDVVREVILPRIERESEEIAALGAPAGEEAQIEAILAAQENAIEEVASEEESASVEDVSAHFTDVSKLMTSYGIINCDNGTVE